MFPTSTDTASFLWPGLKAPKSWDRFFFLSVVFTGHQMVGSPVDPWVPRWIERTAPLTSPCAVWLLPGVHFVTLQSYLLWYIIHQSCGSWMRRMCCTLTNAQYLAAVALNFLLFLEFEFVRMWKKAATFWTWENRATKAVSFAGKMQTHLGHL